MKQRFTAIDIRASICDIRSRIVGLRLQNFYDLGGKTFLLKFSKPDRKEYLVIESGNRFHLTDFSREKSITPSPFSLKIRKHLRARRLTDVRQIGVDRIIDLVFSTDEGGPGTYHIICEFFASGNIILTDHEYTILSILRVVKPNTIKASPEDAKKDSKGAKNDDKKNQSGKKDKNKKNDQTETKSEPNPFSMSVKDTYDVSSLSRQFEAADISKFINAVPKADKKDTLKKLVNDIYLFGPPLTEHVLIEVGLDPSEKNLANFDILEGSENLRKLQEALAMADQLILDFESKPSKGYVLFSDKGSKNAQAQESEQSKTDILNEFHPMLFNQHKNTPHKEYETFANAVDYFFSVIEDQKATMRSKAQEQAAKNKLETIKKEQMGRVDGLLQSEKTNEYKAQLIEENLEIVDQILMIVRSMVAAGQDWKDIQRTIEDEQRKQNYLASYIKELKLHLNMVTLQLTDPYAQYDMCDDDEEDDFESHSSRSDTEHKPEYVNVDIDLNLTAYANARRYYGMKKSSKVKKEKTLAAAEQAFKSAEKKVLSDLKELQQNKPHTGVTKIRKPFWFEKFNWFISSERYLIISGRDMQQNELLVKRYLRKGDLYVHADLHGAASVIIKNPDGGPVPPGTLSQAGSMSVCYSKAWESKIVTSAWWVYDNQVSKTAPSGEYLTTGSFMIRGKKNFLPPSQLVYGFAYLFLVDETSTARHVQNRLASLKLDEEEAKPIIDNTEDISKSDKKKDDNAEAQNSLKSNQDVENEDEESGDNGSDSDNAEDEFSDIGDQVSGQGEANSNDKYGLDYIEVEESSIIQELLGSSQPQDAQRAKKSTKQATSSKPPPSTSNQPKQKNQPTRAKKGKLKKIKKKYADQSDEEREMRMELLGSAKGPQPKGKKAKKLAEQRRIKEETEARRAKLRERDELNSQNDQSQADNELTEGQDPENEQEDSEQAKLEEDEEVRQLLEEENVVVLDDEEVQNLSVFDSLVPYPTEEDNILFAIPVSAPYQSLNKYKYKIKLTPGNLKKGKASKQCMDVFLHHSELLPSEKEAFKIVPEMEALNTILAKVKLNAPNLEAMKKSNKAKTKAKAKAK